MSRAFDQEGWGRTVGQEQLLKDEIRGSGLEIFLKILQERQ